MHADYDRAVLRDRIDLERAGHEFPGNFVANVTFQAIEWRLAAERQASFVVVELEVVGNH